MVTPWVQRCVDLVVAVPGAIATAPIVGAGALLCRRATGESGLFRQRRVGLDGRPFEVVKLRTMRSVAGSTLSTTAGDPRITPIGATLRRFKLDELPQLWNVIRGEMSLVGPRPDVAEVIERIPEPDRGRVLSMRPGITGAATLFFRDEETLLSLVDDPEGFSHGTLIRAKTRINLAALDRATLADHLRLVVMTVRGVTSDRLEPVLEGWGVDLRDVDLATIAELRNSP